MHMCFLFIKGKQFNLTVLGYAKTPEGHFRRVQNKSIRFNASAHNRPLEHFDRMQPATRLTGTFTRKVSLDILEWRALQRGFFGKWSMASLGWLWERNSRG